MPLRKFNLDALGMGVSIACALHCTLLPLAMAALPFFNGVNRTHNTAFEYGMIGLAFVIGIKALRHGYRKHHRQPIPALLFTAGMILLIAKQVWHDWEGVLLAFAVLLILGAHGLNYRLTGRPRRARRAVCTEGDAGPKPGFSVIRNQQ